MTLSQIEEIIRRHSKRDISFMSPSWKRHARVRWKLELMRLEILNVNI